MNIRPITVTGEGVTVAKIVWQLLKRQPQGVVETVLSFNPGLASLGPVLPPGTIVNVPLDEVPTAETERPLIRLWD